MRSTTKALLFAGVSAVALAGIADAAERPLAPQQIVVAQAETADVAAAEQAVAEARAALEAAEAAGKGVKKAQQALDKALKRLDAIRAAAAGETAPDAAPVVADEPRPEPPAETVAEEPAPEPAPAEVTEEAAPEPPPAEVAEEPAPVAPPPEPEVAEEPAPEPPPAAVAEEPAPEPAPADVAKEPAPEAPARDIVEEPRKKPGKKNAEAKGPPPPPAEAKGPPPAKEEQTAEKPKQPLPESAKAIEEGEKVEAAGGRVITKDRGRVVIRHEDEERFRAEGSRMDRRRGEDGNTVITVERPNGETIVTVRDENGDIVKRTRRMPNGREVVLIDNTRRGQRQEPRFDLGSVLPPIVINIPREDYVVESRRVSPQMLFQTLVAPPVEAVERPYTLEEVRYNERVRDKVRRVDVDTVTFEFGQAYVPDSQIDELDGIARAMQAAIDRDDREVFLIEGHTDAVGSEIANLALSDRRAESVAEILTYYYDIPPENLITQGYGESYLKIPTQEPERQNRRVTVRNITPLLNAGG